MIDNRNLDQEAPDKAKKTVLNQLNRKEVDFDDLLSSVGEFGKYQYILFFSTFPFYVYGAFEYYTQLFITEVSTNHWCWVPELENFTIEERRSIAVPRDDRNRLGYSHCLVYDANWTEVLMSGVSPNNTWNKVPCQHGWEFNKSEIPYPTISSEMGWVCERDSYQATAQAMFFIGAVFGGFLIGWISDRFGRLPAAVVSNVIGSVGALISIFARNIIEFSACRFIMGMAYDNCIMMAYLIVLEYVAPKYRTFMSNMSFALFYAFAITTLPWLMLLCGHWKTISLVTSLTLLTALFAPLYLPESPRWLLSKGRTDEAIEKLHTIGRVNKKMISKKLIEQFQESHANKKKDEKVSFIDIMKRPLLRMMFICSCLEFICCTLVFDGLVRSIGQLNFDFFISFSVISFAEFPSMFIISFIMDWTGRKWLTAVCLSISSVFCFLTIFTQSGLLSVVFAVIAKFTVNMGYNAVTQWAAELLPTSIRGSGASFVHICGYFATTLSPYIIYLETYLYWLPLVLIGLIAILGAMLALVLPETANKDMPQTFEDAEELVRSKKFWDFPWITKKDLNDGFENKSYDI